MILSESVQYLGNKAPIRQNIKYLVHQTLDGLMKRPFRIMSGVYDDVQESFIGWVAIQIISLDSSCLYSAHPSECYYECAIIIEIGELAICIVASDF